MFYDKEENNIIDEGISVVSEEEQYDQARRGNSYDKHLDISREIYVFLVV
jgi:hypothetical protein